MEDASAEGSCVRDQIGRTGLFINVRQDGRFINVCISMVVPQ
jgi:hypothetical protein